MDLLDWEPLAPNVHLLAKVVKALKQHASIAKMDTITYLAPRAVFRLVLKDYTHIRRICPVWAVFLLVKHVIRSQQIVHHVLVEVYLKIDVTIPALILTMLLRDNVKIVLLLVQHAHLHRYAKVVQEDISIIFQVV